MPNIPTRTRQGFRCRVGLSILALATLQACSVNPLVRAQVSAPAQKPADARMMLDDAKADLSIRREAYRAKINEFVGASAGTSSALIGLGSLIAVLAASKGVHRDAILGSSVVGGTGLLLGKWNLDQRRLAIYHATVAAFNCAERAAAPMNMRVEDYKSLLASLDTLTKAQTDTANAIADLEVAVQAWTAGSGTGIEAVARPYVDGLVRTKAALAASEAVSQAGYTLADRAQSAGDLLRDAALRIEADADKALGDTLGDLNAVPGVIAMVAGASGSFAPGSGIESALTQALKKAVPAASDKQSANIQAIPPNVTGASARLEAAVVTLGTASGIVQGRVKAQAGRVNTDKLSDCGIGEGHLAMALDPPKIVVPAKAAWRTAVEISGGKAPFVVKPNGLANADVKVSGPDRMASSFEIDIPADKLASAQVLNYRVLDSSSPAKAVSFAIEVTGATAPPPPPAEAPAAAPAPAADKPAPPSMGKVPSPSAAGTTGGSGLDAALGAVSQLNKPFDVNGVTVQFAGPAGLSADRKSLQVAVSCTTTTPLPQAVLRAKLADQLGDRKTLLAGVPIQFTNVANNQACAAKS